MLGKGSGVVELELGLCVLEDLGCGFQFLYYFVGHVCVRLGDVAVVQGYCVVLFVDEGFELELFDDPLGHVLAYVGAAAESFVFPFLGDVRIMDLFLDELDFLERVDGAVILGTFFHHSGMSVRSSITSTMANSRRV